MSQIQTGKKGPSLVFVTSYRSLCYWLTDWKTAFYICHNVSIFWENFISCKVRNTSAVVENNFNGSVFKLVPKKFSFAQTSPPLVIFPDAPFLFLLKDPFGYLTVPVQISALALITNYCNCSFTWVSLLGCNLLGCRHQASFNFISPMPFQTQKLMLLITILNRIWNKHLPINL